MICLPAEAKVHGKVRRGPERLRHVVVPVVGTTSHVTLTSSEDIGAVGRDELRLQREWRRPAALPPLEL